MKTLSWLVLRSQENALIGLLTLVGGVLGVKDILSLVMPSDVGIYLILSALGALLFAQMNVARKIKSLAPLPTPQESRLFHPFTLNAAEIWPREDEAKRLANSIVSSERSHVVVTGPSGAGKSTLLMQLVQPHLISRFELRNKRRYEGILANIISDFDGGADFMAGQRHLLDNYDRFIRATSCPVRAVFEPGFGVRNQGALSLWRELQDYFDRLFSQQGQAGICFVFDQIERYVNMLHNDIHKGGNKLNGFETYFFLQFIRLCRQHPNCRTVFVVRAESLYDSFDFLETLISEGPGPSTRVTYFLCPGINSESSPDGMIAIRKTFKRLDGAAQHFENFEHINGLDSRTLSNTFLTQLTGFLVEHFYQTDPNVKDMLIGQKNRLLALRFFFDHLLNDYRRATGSQDSLDVLKTVLFTIAIENRLTGQSVGRQRVAALAHMPQALIDEVIAFLVRLGVLLKDEVQDNDESYRFVHDILSDYVIENEQLATHPVLKEEIRGLSESQAPLGARVEEYANLILDWGGRVNVGLVAIWMFLLSGLVTLRIDLCEQVSPWFQQFVWLAQPCSVVNQYYVPIYFMHAVWLTFIYHIDRDYLRYTLRSGILRGVSASMPAVGAMLAIILAHSPVVFVVPVLAGGLMMGSALLLGVLDRSFVGRCAQENFGWGAFTVGNMLLGSLLTAIAWLVLWDSVSAMAFWGQLGHIVSTSVMPIRIDRDSIAIAVMYCLNLFMIYFWLQIRRRQQSRLSFAARLALYDRTRLEQV